MTTRVQHDVADLALASHGINRVEWADRSMPVLRAIRERFAEQRPFDGVRIAACLNITAETANLMRTLQAGGAEIRLCASNPLSTQDDTAAALVSEYGVSVFARHRSDTVTYRQHLDAVLARPPALVLDDACDLATALHADYQDLLSGLRGGCEETTSGIVRLRAMASAGGLRYPVVAVTDTPTKNLIDNRIGTGQSTIDALLRSTNTLIAGANVVVAGFGDGGQGVAARLDGLGARVIVTEVDPARALDATLHGYPVLSMNEAAKLGDIFITVTGNRDVIRSEHMALMKDGAVLANAGHFDLEIDVAALADTAIERRIEVRPHVDEYVQPDGRRLLLVAEGRVANLAGAEGHPAAVMDIAFGIQALSAEWLLRTDPGTLRTSVLDVPPGIDREVARLKLASLGVTLDVLTEVQAEYLTSWNASR